MDTLAAPRVSIVVPCRNEGSTIGAVVSGALSALEQWGYAGEVVVCDNNSTDDSVEEATRAGARVVRQSIRGYGAACLRGMEESDGEFIVVADGDGTYDMSILHRFIEPLRAGYDMVLGTRRNGEIHPGAMAAGHGHVLEPAQNWLLRRFFRFRVSDVRCGLRSVQRSALGRMSLGSTGMEFATEWIVGAARAKLRTVEVPVSFRARSNGQQRRSISDGWRTVRFMLLLSPTQLFLVPGFVLLLLGLLLEIALIGGPVAIGPLRFDYHFMFVGGALAILGLQVVLLGVYAKTYALVHDAEFADAWIRRFHLRYSLERGVALGGVLFGAGLIINATILGDWLAAGRGMLFAVRPAMLALTLMVLGAEVIFAAFFLSLLRGTAFGRS